MQNYFELFQLPPRFDIDAQALEQAFHQIQNRVHPDRFVSGGDAEKRVAMQWATEANQAYRTLKNPLQRAIYLCELNRIDLRAEQDTAMPLAFLMQQIEWREQLDEVRSGKDLNALGALEQQMRAASEQQIGVIAELFSAQDFAGAAEQVRQWMFLEKFSEDIAQAIDAMAG